MRYRLFCLLGLGLALAVAQGGQSSGQASNESPDGAEQDRMLARMHEYGDHYVSGLPNFLCEQVTRQLQTGLKSEKWRQGDTLTASLSFHDGREQRSLIQVNGKDVDPAKRMRWHSALRTEGEFGTLIETVLGASSQATFTWNRWEDLHGKRLAVFDYSVDRFHSTKTLSLSDLGTATLAYFGSIDADPDTGAVWRISDSAKDIPPQLRTQSIATVIDYDELAIGANRFLLPVGAVVLVIGDREKIRNELTFRNYRKFAADTSITYDK